MTYLRRTRCIASLGQRLRIDDQGEIKAEAKLASEVEDIVAGPQGLRRKGLTSGGKPLITWWAV